MKISDTTNEIAHISIKEASIQLLNHFMILYQHQILIIRKHISIWASINANRIANLKQEKY